MRTEEEKRELTRKLNREFAYGEASKEEEDIVDEAIMDLLTYELTEDELVDKLGDKLTDEMTIYHILDDLEEGGDIYSITTYKAVG